MHLRSFAQLERGLHEESQEVKKALCAALSHQYDSDICLFEHGMASTGERILCTTDHAHMHFVPFPTSADIGVIENLPWTEFDGSLLELARLSQGSEYMLYESTDGVCCLLTDKQGFG